MQRASSGLRNSLVLIGLHFLVACGGGDSVSPPPAPPPPPPGPVVATVAVSPSVVTLTLAGRQQLAASPKTATGDSVPGKTVTWASSNQSVATVSASGLVSAVAAGTTSVSAAVDGRTGTAQVTVVAAGDNVREEASRGVSDTIGLAGGVLRASSGSGVRYVLTIPAGALRQTTRVTMVPVATIQSTPFSQVVGAVDLQPSGLTLAKPAILAIDAPPPSDTSLRMVGFSYQGDADSLIPALARDSARVIRITVPRFGQGGGTGGAGAGPRAAAVQTSTSGGVGAAFTTVGGMLGFLGTLGPSGQSQTYINALAGTAPGDLAAIYTLMRQWMTNSIAPRLRGAVSDIQLYLAVSDYNWWLNTSYGIVTGRDAALQAERDAAAQAALPVIKRVMLDNDQQCLDHDDLTAAAGVLYWQTVAEDFGLATAANQLDRASVLASFCLKIVLTTVSFPDPAAAGVTGTLDLRAAIQFRNDPAVGDRTMTWQIDVQGSNADGTTHSLSDAFGRFTKVITPTGTAALIVRVEACLFAAEVPYGDVCASDLVVRNFLRDITGDVTVATMSQFDNLRDVRRIAGKLIIRGLPIADLQGLENLEEVSDLWLISMPNVTGLNGLSSLRAAGGIELQDLPRLTSIAGMPRLATLRNLRITGLPLLTRPAMPLGVSALESLTIENSGVNDLDGFRGVRPIRQLGLKGLGVTDLTPLGGAAVNELALVDLVQLRSLGTIQLGPNPNRIVLGKLPLLTGIAPLAALTGVGELLLGDRLPATTLLPNLTSVKGSLMIFTGSQPGGSSPLPQIQTARQLEVRVGTLLGGGPGCSGTGPVTVSLPALTRVERFAVSNGSPGCPAAVSAPNLNVTESMELSGAIASVRIKSMITSPTSDPTLRLLSIRGTTLTSFAAPIDVGTVFIQNNPLLQSATITGRVRGNLFVQNNPNLDLATILVTVDGVSTVVQ